MRRVSGSRRFMDEKTLKQELKYKKDNERRRIRDD